MEIGKIYAVRYMSDNGKECSLEGRLVEDNGIHNLYIFETEHGRTSVKKGRVIAVN